MTDARGSNACFICKFLRRDLPDWAPPGAIGYCRRVGQFVGAVESDPCPWHKEG
jgi:hypothetical protein